MTKTKCVLARHTEHTYKAEASGWIRVGAMVGKRGGPASTVVLMGALSLSIHFEITFPVYKIIFLF